MPLRSPSAYLLVSHGSRDPRPKVAVEQLATDLHRVLESIGNTAGHDSQQLRVGEHGADSERTAILLDRLWPTQLNKREPLVGCATLELDSRPLHQQIQLFADRACRIGCGCVQILPLFLLPGAHVREDIPTEVAIAQQTLGQDLDLDLRPFLGSHLGLVSQLRAEMQIAGVTAWIVIAHGSRRPGGNNPVERIATQLGALPAYWSVQPGLEERVQELVRRGHQDIGIVPYFLFSGGITAAIAQTVQQLRQRHPGITLHLTQPLGATPELAQLIVDLTA